MRIVSSALNGGEIPKKYGKYGNQKSEFDIPTMSVPFTIEDAPEKTVSYALVLDDVDSVPVCGFVWIHWIAANITTTDIAENASINASFPQGINSWVGTAGKEAAIGYGGMTPPDAPHIYTLRVYALDCRLDLEDGFFYNQLIHAIKGHILAVAEVEGIYHS